MRMSTDHGIKTKYVAPCLLAAALAIAGMAVASESDPTYELHVAFDIPRATIIGTAIIDAHKGAELSIDRGDLRILSLTNGSRRIAPDTPGSDPLTLHAEGPIQIRYEGTFSGPEGDVIDGDKIVLRQTWYPVVEGTYRYHLTATLPRDFVAISEADTVRRTEADGQATFSFDLPYPQRDWDGITLVASRQPAISLTVPITIYFERGRSEIATLQISGQHLEFRHLLDEKPIRVALDENYDVFRHLTPAEMPPTIDNLLTRSRVILVASPNEEKKFAQLINAFASEEAQVAWYGWGHERAQKAGRLPAVIPGGQQGTSTADWRILILRNADIGDGTDMIVPSLILLGKDNPLIARLFGGLELPRGGFTVTVLKHPKSPGNVVVILTATSKAEVDAAYREIINHPRYSSAAFNGGKLTSYELRNGARGISAEITAERR